jgi:glutamine cyclotransferase
MRRPVARGLIAGLFLVLVGTTVPACADEAAAPAPVSTMDASAPAPVQRYTVVASYPHDTHCFIEGMQWTGAGFVESCGLYGASSVRHVSLAGAVTRSAALPRTAFGEGLVALGSKLFQMTWKERIVFVRDAKTLKETSRRALPASLKEGWGMTTDGRSLIASDGTPTVRWIDPKTFAVTRSISVRDGGVEVRNINELEMIDGELWANVWTTDRILRIDPATGSVHAVLDLTGLRPADTLNQPDAVLNGIAYDAVKKRIFVTGKTWATVFEIRVAA